jgi:hypothetical protein
MKLVEGIPSDTKMACQFHASTEFRFACSFSAGLNNTANPPDQLCSLEETCAFGGFHKEEPNQWFRFITPIFIHGMSCIQNYLPMLTIKQRNSWNHSSPSEYARPVHFFSPGIAYLDEAHASTDAYGSRLSEKWARAGSCYYIWQQVSSGELFIPK